MSKPAADPTTDLASARLVPLLADKITGDAKLTVEFPSVAGDKEAVNEKGEKVFEDAIFHGTFDRGDRLPLYEVASRLGAPSYSISGVGGGGGGKGSNVFAVAVVDPDAPGGVGGSSSSAPWLHHLVVDAPGPDVARGRVLCEWAPPSPPRGLHRYVFLLYQQEGPLGSSAKPPKSRARFQVKDWASTHGLGDPVDATFFSTSADEE